MNHGSGNLCVLFRNANFISVPAYGSWIAQHVDLEPKEEEPAPEEPAAQEEAKQRMARINWAKEVLLPSPVQKSS